MTNLDKAKLINDFCLTAVTITAMVAVSVMATTALTKSDREETFTISTKRDESKDINDVCRNESPIKYTNGDLCNNCFRVDDDGCIIFKKSGYYTFYSQIKKDNCDQFRVVIHDAEFKVAKTASEPCVGMETDKCRDYMSDLIHVNAGDKISVLLAEQICLAEPTAVGIEINTNNAQNQEAPPTISKSSISDYARLTITRIQQKQIYFHKQ